MSATLTLQPALSFDAPELLPTPPHQRHSEASRAAAESVRENAAAWRARLRAWFSLRGAEGATDLELFAAFPNANQSNLRPRRVDLMHAGDVVDSGKKRLTPSERLATVWVHREFAPRVWVECGDEDVMISVSTCNPEAYR
jgi:hypothetical protein